MSPSLRSPNFNPNSPHNSLTLPRSKRREIVVLGFRGVGKSSVVIQFVENTWVETYYPTIENTFEKNMNFRGEPIALQILDTTGQDELTIFSPRHMVGIHGYLLVYDVTSRQSFNVVQHIYEKMINVFSDRYIPIVLVGNKCDLDHDRAVSCEEGRQLAQEWQCAFIEVSAKHDENIKAAFHQLLQQVQENEGGGRDVDPQTFGSLLRQRLCCCCHRRSGSGDNDDAIQDQNGSLMGSPVAGKGNRFRRSRRRGSSGNGGGNGNGGSGSGSGYNRKRSRANSAASDYFLSYDGQHNGDTESTCCRSRNQPVHGNEDSEECCVQSCTLSVPSQKRIYYCVGFLTVLMFFVGIGSMFTGFQIAIQANDNVPSIPSHPTGGNASSSPSSSSSSSSLFPPSPTPAPTPAPSSGNGSSYSSYSDRSTGGNLDPGLGRRRRRRRRRVLREEVVTEESAPIPWKPVNPSNQQGAWFAYGAIGLGLYTVVVSLAGLRGVLKLNKDLLRLFSGSVALDFVVHVCTYLVFTLYPTVLKPPTGCWISSNASAANVVLPCVFFIEVMAAVCSFVLQFNLLGTDDEEDVLNDLDADHPYLVSSFDGSRVNQQSGWGNAYLADDDLDARSTSTRGRRGRNQYGSSGGGGGGGGGGGRRGGYF